MSNDQSKSDEPILDRRQSTSGITAGGRRNCDRGLIKPQGKKARIWMAASFILSGVIIAWAFSLPFRSGDNSISLTGSKSNASTGATMNVNLVNSDDPDERVTKDEYIEKLMDQERKLMAQVRAKNRRFRNPPTELEIKRSLALQAEEIKRQAKLLAEIVDNDFEPGTVEWQAIEELRKVLQDTGQ